MQAFDTQDAAAIGTSPPLSQKAVAYSDNNTNFLAMQGTNAPRKSVEYFNVGNRFGAAGKGEFKARYGLNRPAEVDVSTKENLSAMIVKDGVTMCSPGQEMRDGRCVPIVSETGCQPGWNKKGGVCVKGEHEFSSGMEATDAAQVGVVGNDGVTLNRMRKYMQEMQTGTPEPGTFTQSIYFWLMMIVVALFVAGFIWHKFLKPKNN